jgi:hypothetical protein
LDSISPEEYTGLEIALHLKSGKVEMYFVYLDSDNSLMGIIIASNEYDNNTLVIVGAAGNVDNEWEMLDKDYTQLAKSKRCTSYEFRARRGFLRTFKKYGIVEKYTVMRKTFNLVENNG